MRRVQRGQRLAAADLLFDHGNLFWRQRRGLPELAPAGLTSSPAATERSGVDDDALNVRDDQERRVLEGWRVELDLLECFLEIAAAPAIPLRDAKDEECAERVRLELNRKLADALAYKVDRLTRDLKAGENENARLRKRQDELVADLEHLRSQVARWKAQDGTETATEPIRSKGRRKKA